MAVSKRLRNSGRQIEQMEQHEKVICIVSN